MKASLSMPHLIMLEQRTDTDECLTVTAWENTATSRVDELLPQAQAFKSN